MLFIVAVVSEEAIMAGNLSRLSEILNSKEKVKRKKGIYYGIRCS